MAFPLMPIPSAYDLPAPTTTYLGGATTSGDGFPSATVTTSAKVGPRYIVAVLALGNVGAGVSTFTINGVAATEIIRQNGLYIFYLLVTGANSNVNIAGTMSASGGRSAVYVHEIMQSELVNKSGPVTSGKVLATGTSASLFVPTSSNSLVIGGGVLGGTGTVTVSASPNGKAILVNQNSLESSTQHLAFRHSGTGVGTDYTFTRSADNRIYMVASVWR